MKIEGKNRGDTSLKGDRLFKGITTLSSILLLALMGAFLVTLTANSHLSIRQFGLGFLWSQEWNPVTEEFGALSSIYGTIISTLIAMVIAVPLSLIIALFLVELAPPFISKIAGGAIELLAAVPSIIFGMWGLFVFAPYMSKHIQPAIGKSLGFLPLFKGPPMGIGMLTAGIILALMILPFVSSVMRDVFKMVPAVVKESGYGIGGTVWEVTSSVTVRYGIKGMIGACFLGLGRAIGETMAVTFVIGNDHGISASLFSPSNSIASTLANEFAEAGEPLYISSLVELGLVLFLMTLVIQIAAQIWLKKLEKSSGRGL